MTMPTCIEILNENIEELYREIQELKSFKVEKEECNHSDSSENGICIDCGKEVDIFDR